MLPNQAKTDLMGPNLKSSRPKAWPPGGCRACAAVLQAAGWQLPTGGQEGQEPAGRKQGQAVYERPSVREEPWLRLLCWATKLLIWGSRRRILTQRRRTRDLPSESRVVRGSIYSIFEVPGFKKHMWVCLYKRMYIRSTLELQPPSRVFKIRGLLLK